MAFALEKLSATEVDFTGRTGLAAGGRLLTLLNGAERRTRREFLRLIGRQRGLLTLERLTTLFEQGRFPEALALLDDVAPAFANTINEAYVLAGQSTAAVIGRALARPLIAFDRTNARAVARMAETRGRLIQAMRENEQARLAVTLRNGLADGKRMDEIARTFRARLGLTPSQEQAVYNFRRALEMRSPEALNRALRDRRFDPTVNRAINLDEPLTVAQMDRMERRYRERFIAYRSNVIARTEAVRAVHEGDEDMWQQAVSDGTVSAEDITTSWVTAGDERVRGSHAAMNGQERAFGVPFTSGNGNNLKFPGDSSAPASDTINCRCVLRRNIPQAG